MSTPAAALSHLATWRRRRSHEVLRPGADEREDRARTVQDRRVLREPWDRQDDGNPRLLRTVRRPEHLHLRCRDATA